MYQMPNTCERDCSEYRLRDFAHLSPNFTGSLRSVKFRISGALVSQRSNISEIQSKIEEAYDRAMISPNLV